MNTFKFYVLIVNHELLSKSWLVYSFVRQRLAVNFSDEVVFGSKLTLSSEGFMKNMVKKLILAL